MKNFSVGAHLSVAGGIHLAIERAANFKFNSLQIFTHSPRAWNAKNISDKEINDFISARLKHKINYVVVHAPYLPNLASPDNPIRKKSIYTILNDIILADKINADFYVIHPGSHKKTGVENGINTLADSLSFIFKKHNPKLTFLLETMTGAGSLLGSSFDELASIIDKVHEKCPDVNLGICIDTAHIFAAGFDIRKENVVNNLVNIISKSVGRKTIKLIHSNDSFEPLGSKKDRHNHIGKGEIGIEGFENLLKNTFFRKLPWILETPKTDENSDLNNKTILEKLFNSYC